MEDKKEEGWTGTKIFTAVIFALFVIIVVGNSISDKTHSAHKRANTQLGSDKLLPKKPKKTWRERDNSIMAYIMMETFIKRRLKSPSTADFQGLWSGRTVTKSHTVYSTRSYVDSQNGFSAMIRTKFWCQVKQISEDDWELVAFKVIK